MICWITDNKVSKLKCLSVYECDIQLFKLISDVCAPSLESLTIAKWYQPSNAYDTAKDMKLKDEDFQEVRSILVGGTNGRTVKFSKLERFNFCSTWFTLDFQKEEINEQNDDALSLTGNRHLELIFFTLKNQLIELRIG